MTIKELKEFVAWETGRLDEVFEGSFKEKTLWAALKIAEEAGEVAEQAMCVCGYQRLVKILENPGLDNLGKEIADVIIVAMILAERLGIDVEKSIKEKIEIVRNRTYKTSQLCGITDQINV